ncbi:septal ring lytic transglycosylase RlpA family protein [Roseofilum sp. BLCC_M154]|uniref:Probable endolytic peptidoglycan transglycosylase RlpA n=1 Tax=Roseofilum acuticapitatum BLCC-M154 TaxID=3022444 RepID=A0ABT7AME2_9CYAN|nr:septal ring lytic transglycosylase RlpA family protein [Roseofilum acuticapitatum]MDJ1168056.1 septal ring lytic transglycosylase RlpA family protein [Roseofilum acuticapitatum BLCC-M154]
MNQHLWKSLTISALLLTLGSGSSGHAEPSNTTSNSIQSELEARTESEQEITPAPAAQQAPELTITPSRETEIAASSQPPRASVTKIYPHTLDGQAAATLYVQNIPVLTFLGETLTQEKTQRTETLSATPVVMANLSDTEPVREAEAVAEKLSQWVRTPEDAQAIAVTWDKDLEAYIIRASDQTLVTMGKDVILPDTTNNSTQDAVQATNRLRRLLGNAPPIEEIYGKPVIAPGKEPHNNTPAQPQFVAVQALSGWASWYGPGFHGNLTANGEVYNQYGLTAAHRSLPFGTIVRVTNMDNGRSLIVRINDRGPYTRNRIIDLSKGAAQELGLISSGVAPVRVEVMQQQ